MGEPQPDGLHIDPLEGQRADAALDRLVRLAAQITGGEGVAALCFAESSRLTVPSALGLSEPLESDRQVPLSHSVSQYVVADGAPLVVSDAREHPVLAGDPFFTGQGVVAYAGYPVHGPDGVVLGVLCLSQTTPREWTQEQVALLCDLAGLIETEIALQRRNRQVHSLEERLRAVVDGVADTAVLITDSDGIITWMNAGAERILALGAADTIGVRSLPSVLQAAQPLGADPGEGRARDWLVFHGPRRTRVVSARSRVLRDPAGEPDGHVLFAEDVGLRRERVALLRDAARQQEEALQRLADLEWARTVFVATASHELRTPLSSILGYTDLLIEGAAGPLSPEQLELVTRVDRNSKRLASFSDALLDLSRLDSASPNDSRTLIDANVPAERAWQTLGPQVASRGLHAQLETCDGPPYISGDGAQVERALVHLLENAVKFTPDGGTIRLTVRTTADSLEYEVADTGIGIPEAEHRSVFEPFFRTRVAHARAAEGAGLGLSIVRRIAEAHRGLVRVLPGHGSGTVVIMKFPTEQPEAAAPPAAPSPPGLGAVGPPEHDTTSGSLEAELHAALDGSVDELVLHYQPVVDLTTGTVVAVESLVRWLHPTRGLLGPDEFLPTAEATGLIHQLGDWILDCALREAASLVHEGRELDVAVNFSACQIDEHVVGKVQRALVRTGMRPQRLTIEVTESSFVQDQEATAAAYAGLSELGVRIAIDNFGTGFTSLLHLRRHPISLLKIDQGFVAGLGDTANDEAMCASIIRLAAAMGASAVGVGVETVAQYAALRSLGCLRGQGFLWSPAVPLDELDAAFASCDRVASPRPEGSPSRVGLPEDVTALITSMHAEGASMHTIAAALNRTGGRHPDGVRWTAAAVAQGLAAARHAEATGDRNPVDASASTSETRRSR